MLANVNLKISAIQMEVIPGRPDINAKKVLDYIRQSVDRQDDIVIFPEMAIPGYLLGDEWENQAFINDAFGYNEEIRAATSGIIAIWGNVDVDPAKINEDGRIRKYNAAFISQNGDWIGKGKTHKALLPNYREFDDSRHFFSMQKEAFEAKLPMEEYFKPFIASVRDRDLNIGLILCEDMWSDDYEINPLGMLLKNGSDIIVNISCSPWSWRKNDKRHRVVKARLRENPVPLVYVNNIGIQNNGKNIFLFDGNTTIYNAAGFPAKIARNYQEEQVRVVLDNDFDKIAVDMPVPDIEQDVEDLYQGLLYGIRKFFHNLNNPRAVIGTSGGIDSSLSTALLALALGPERVFAINMPTRYNSPTTRNAARKLAENLKINYAIVPVEESFQYTVKQLNSTVFRRYDDEGSETRVSLSDLNIENIQARDRGSRILAGIASALNAIFVNNGNKTEIALGYSTLYGDVNGAISILGDIYKMEVYRLSRYINKIHGWDIIPKEALEVIASAELSENQNVDEGKGDPILYPYHDKLMKAFIEWRLDPEDILRHYRDGKLASLLDIDKDLPDRYFPSPKSFIDDLEHKWRSFKTGFFKRVQAPPILTVSKRAFGFDLREAQNGIHLTRKYLEIKKELLQSR